METTSELSTFGNATAGADYIAVNDTVFFAHGASRATIHLAIVDDTIVEVGNNSRVELLSVQLDRSSCGAPLRTGETMTVITIEDNEPPPVIMFAPSSVNLVVPEGSVAPVMVVRSGSINSEVTVHYDIIPGNATHAGEAKDYNLTHGILVFGPGEFNHTINVPTIADHHAAGDGKDGHIEDVRIAIHHVQEKFVFDNPAV